MTKIAFAVFLLILSFFISKAQDIRSTNDAASAVELTLNRTYTFQDSPTGFGIQEFPSDLKRSRNYFLEERNTAWFKIKVPYAGVLDFEIRPHHSKDDYDWMLFTRHANLAPQLVRSNNARNDPKINSKTGLHAKYSNLYEDPGPGKGYSKPLSVRRGEELLLVIDNIYPEGKGFDLRLNLAHDPSASIAVKGKVKDKVTGSPIPARISLEDDSTGTTIINVVADSSGRFDLLVPTNTPIRTTALYPGYLIESLKTNSSVHSRELELQLEPISQGKKMVFDNLKFFPNNDVLLPSSAVELARLSEFLKENPTQKVRIIGHTNNNAFANPKYLQLLSFNRAIAIKNALVRNGIAEIRLSCAGMGGKSPLVNSKDPVEGLKNLRVEVVVQ